MNPHFIFNALTGIHMLLLRGDKSNSLRAVKKFKALLIRSWYSAIDSPKSLYASSLSEEIRFLSDYVELKKMRLNTKVDFNISTSSTFQLFRHFSFSTFWKSWKVEMKSWTVEKLKCCKGWNVEKVAMLEPKVEKKSWKVEMLKSWNVEKVEMLK